jgi:hypothetical protein
MIHGPESHSHPVGVLILSGDIFDGLSVHARSAADGLVHGGGIAGQHRQEH